MRKLWRVNSYRFGLDNLTLFENLPNDPEKFSDPPRHSHSQKSEDFAEFSLTFAESGQNREKIVKLQNERSECAIPTLGMLEVEALISWRPQKWAKNYTHASSDVPQEHFRIFY